MGGGLGRGQGQPVPAVSIPRGLFSVRSSQVFVINIESLKYISE
jgi:hypothetical protein